MLVACERSSTPDVTSTDTANISNDLPIMLSLLQRLPDGRLIPANGTVSPSLPCPQIKISKFDVENLRKDPAGGHGYVCDLSITGTLTAAICDVIPGSDGVIETIRLFHNDGEKPIGSFTQLGTIRLGKRTEFRNPLVKEFVDLAKLGPAIQALSVAVEVQQSASRSDAPRSSVTIYRVRR